MWNPEKKAHEDAEQDNYSRLSNPKRLMGLYHFGHTQTIVVACKTIAKKPEAPVSRGFWVLIIEG